MQFRGANNMLTCGWQQASIMPDLEDNKVSAVLCISRNKKPSITLEMYTVIGVQHYSSSFEGLTGDALERELIRTAKIIHHFVSNKQRILIHHTNEDSAVPFVMVYYYIWQYYSPGLDGHNLDDRQPRKKPEISIVSQSIQELELNGIDSDLPHETLNKLYKLENKYCAHEN